VKQGLLASVNHAQICSWNQPVLSNDGRVYCLRKQREPLIGFKLTTDRHPPIMSQYVLLSTPRRPSSAKASY